MDVSIETPGPEIDGQPSIISFVGPGELKTYPYLLQLRLLINAAFTFKHTGPASNYLFPSDVQRLETDDQLPAEFGSETFTYIVSSLIPEDGGPPRLYATGSGSPFKPKTSHEGVPNRVTETFQMKTDLDLEKNEVWELKVLVVEPTLQNQGLGSLLMKLVEGEVVKRSAESRLQLSKLESSALDVEAPKLNNEIVIKRLVMALATSKEVNEAYYLKKGWVTTEVNPVGKAFNASRDWHALMSMDLSIKTTGPEINGQPSIISFFAPGQLKSYPYLLQLRLLVNVAFVSNHSGPASNYLFASDLQRLDTDDQLPAEFGSETFTYIISSLIPENGDPPRLYATGSGSPFKPRTPQPGVPEHVTKAFQMKTELDLKRHDVWELKVLVVDPTLQKQGLGGLLMKFVEGEIVKRSAESSLQLSKLESSIPAPNNGDADVEVSKSNDEIVARRLVMVLITVKEVNEAYYLRRGWVTTETNAMGRGFNASRDWHNCWMQKDVSI
ncbi:hypothetical protein FRB98_006112 [Tulasnella sp. 332]|nr:hypothetical protein FRB98_006112 [Tulasnella sp. 332]